MSTRAKLQFTSYAATALMLANVFARPLHIPFALQWVLLAGVFALLGLMFYLLNRQKEKRRGSPPEIPGSNAAAPRAGEDKASSWPP